MAERKRCFCADFGVFSPRWCPSPAAELLPVLRLERVRSMPASAPLTSELSPVEDSELLRFWRADSFPPLSLLPPAEPKAERSDRESEWWSMEFRGEEFREE